MQRIDRRAELASIIGLCLQVGFFALLVILFKHSTSPAVLAESWHVLGGLAIWLLIMIELYQQRLAWQQRQEVEELERERLGRSGGAVGVFAGLSGDEVLPMERRLKLVKRWFVPIAALANAAVLVFLAGRLIPSAWPMAWLTDALERQVVNQWATLGIMATVALICFLISRYTLGLSRTKAEWRLVRAGANYAMGNALVCFALVIVLALSSFGTTLPERIVGQVIPFVMLFLAAEIVLNLLLDVYRPRVPGEEYRPVYESRVLGLFCEPEGVMRSIAHTIDYQFGFQVSDTWFYQLLQRAIVPLVLFAVVSLYLLSMIVIVKPGQEAIVTRFGAKPDTPLSEGWHTKWPWPIDKATIYPVDEIRRMVIGHGDEDAEHEDGEHDLILWTKQHVAGDEFQILVASKELEDEFLKQRKNENPQAAPVPSGREQRLSPVNIFAGALVIHYNTRGGQLLDYVSNYQSPDDILEDIAYRRWTQYMASVDILDVMTAGRGATSVDLQKAIQAEADRRQLGLNIKAVELVGIHPPIEVGDAYEVAINARQDRETLILRAQGDANEQLPNARATASEITSEALAYKYGKVTLEQAKASRFSKQLQSYQAAPDVYFLRNYLDVLVSATKHVRKFIVAVKDPKKVLLIVNDEETVPAGLLGLGEEIGRTLQEQEGP